jgi:hypothetical protein
MGKATHFCASDIIDFFLTPSATHFKIVVEHFFWQYNISGLFSARQKRQHCKRFVFSLLIILEQLMQC